MRGRFPLTIAYRDAGVNGFIPYGNIAAGIGPGLRLGYRRRATAGRWSVICTDGKGGNWLKAFADDIGRLSQLTGAKQRELLSNRRQAFSQEGKYVRQHERDRRSCRFW